MAVVFEERHFQALDPEREELASVREREEMRAMLLELDDEIPPAPYPVTHVLGLHLHRHWSAEHRTALWFPHPFNF